MTVPGIVQSALDDEEIAARVSLGGEDELFVTPSKTAIYRSEGLLSDESIEEYPHEATKLILSEGRRKTRFTLEYPLEGERDFAVPAKVTEDVLQPVLAGILSGNGITDPGETVTQTYRFSELTLIITSERLVKHIGGAVWDEEFEQFHFEDATNLSFEDGSVATQVVLTVDGRPQRIKAPNEQAGDVSERLKRALCSYHDVDSLESLNDKIGEEDDGDDEPADPAAVFGEGVDPLEANPPVPEGVESDDERTAATASVASKPSGETTASAGETKSEDTSSVSESDDESGASSTSPAGSASSDHDQFGDSESDQFGASESDQFGASESDQFDGSGFEPAKTAAEEDILDRLDHLETVVDRQTNLLEKQQVTIERLIEELRAGR